MIVHIRLREELQRRGISAYRLVQVVQGRITPKAIYALASGKAKRIDLETLGVVATALERASGQPVTAADLLEFQSEPVEPETQPFQWNQAKQYTDPEAEDFTPVYRPCEIETVKSRPPDSPHEGRSDRRYECAELFIPSRLTRRSIPAVFGKQGHRD